MPDLFDSLPEEPGEQFTGPVPEIGVHHDIPFPEYCEWDALNASKLVWAKVTGEHFQAALQGDIYTDSPDKKFGRAVHCRLLEPQRYYDEYLIATPCCGTLGKTSQRAGEECGKKASYLHKVDGKELWYCGTHKPPEATEPEDYIDQAESVFIERIAQKIYSHPVVKLIRQHGGFESSIVWQNKDDLCKARLDKVIPKATNFPAFIVDVKKGQRGRCDQLTFGKDCVKWNYVLKAAWYCDGWEAVTGERASFIWIVVEDKPPHSIGVYQAKQWQIDLGRKEYKQCLQLIRYWRESNRWPGYSDKIQELILPDYYVNSFEAS